MGAGLMVDDFINHPSVQQCIAELTGKFHKDHPLIVSDVMDNEGHQYVNLVQKGGGVLGVALVGYTYILEQMGIRFIRLAGTSAGAINTALMMVCGNGKEDAKSKQVLQEICGLDFFALVDGPPVVRWIIKRFITNKNFTHKIKKWITGILLGFLCLLAGDFIFLGLQHTYPWLLYFTKVFFALTALWLLLTGLLIFYVSVLLKGLKNKGFGINPGNFFYDWIKQRLISNGVRTVTDLKMKASKPVPGLCLREGVVNEEGLKGLDGDVTFIVSELVTQNKIQFPEMWNLFRKEMDALQPAGFIRASMSIPVFFESYFIDEIPCDDPEIQKIWMDTFNENDPPSTARFVDGGILSNFPINLFFNPKIKVPRLPSFGIDLDDSEPADSRKHAESWTLMGYLVRMLHTIRGYYDKEFLLTNKIFRKGIGVIPLEGYNWLNFFLTDEDKINLFVSGAQAATGFIQNFSWEDYKNERHKVMEQIKQDMSAITDKKI